MRIFHKNYFVSILSPNSIKKISEKIFLFLTLTSIGSFFLRKLAYRNKGHRPEAP